MKLNIKLMKKTNFGSRVNPWTIIVLELLRETPGPNGSAVCVHMNVCNIRYLNEVVFIFLQDHEKYKQVLEIKNK